MRVALRLGIIVVILIGIVYGILTLVGVFNEDDVSDGSASNSSSQSGGGSTNRDDSGLFSSPFTEASDLLSGMGIHRESGVTITSTIVRDTRNDFEHPKAPRGLPDSDSAVDITSWSSLKSVSINDIDACTWNEPAFACGGQQGFFVACGDEAKALSAGPDVILVGEVVSAPPFADDDKSRRISLVIDDGDPNNNWTANAGNDSDFRQGYDTFFHVDRPNDSDEWTVTKTTIGSGSMVTTGETGVRAIVKDRFFMMIIPESELPAGPAGIEEMSGSLIAESFSGSLPDGNRDFIHDPNVPYSGDRTQRQFMFFNSDLAATCP